MTSPTNSGKVALRAFTLVELLVVVCIVAVLMALFLPALSKAKHRADRIACASNLRQQSVAVNAYATDNDGFLPTPGVGSCTLSAMALYLSGTNVNLGVLHAQGYVGKGGEVLFCPSRRYVTGSGVGGGMPNLVSPKIAAAYLTTNTPITGFPTIYTTYASLSRLEVIGCTPTNANLQFPYAGYWGNTIPRLAGKLSRNFPSTANAGDSNWGYKPAMMPMVVCYQNFDPSVIGTWYGYGMHNGDGTSALFVDGVVRYVPHPFRTHSMVVGSTTYTDRRWWEIITNYIYPSYPLTRCSRSTPSCKNIMESY